MNKREQEAKRAAQRVKDNGRFYQVFMSFMLGCFNNCIQSEDKGEQILMSLKPEEFVLYMFIAAACEANGGKAKIPYNKLSIFLPNKKNNRTYIGKCVQHLSDAKLIHLEQGREKKSYVFSIDEEQAKKIADTAVSMNDLREILTEFKMLDDS